MYKIGDYIVYRNDVCKIKNIKNNKINGITYYIMTPIDDESLIIDTPIDNKMGYIRNLISLEKANKLTDSIPNIKPIEDFSEKNLEYIYKDFLYKGSHIELIKIIKTSYIRNNERTKNRKRISDKDDKYFRLAEKYLYNELSIVFNMSFEETKNYIYKRVCNYYK